MNLLKQKAFRRKLYWKMKQLKLNTSLMLYIYIYIYIYMHNIQTYMHIIYINVSD